MKRIAVCLATAVAAAFALNVGAQPPENDQDRPREERRDGDRRDGDRDRGDRDRGDRRPGGFGFGGPGGPGGFRMPPHPVMKAIDANGDNELSEEEIKNASKTLMALDKNGDKKLAGDEIRPEFPSGPPGGFGGGFGGPPNPEQFVSRMLESDADKDGKLTEEELPERMRGMFGRLDENGDDAIDKSELEAMAKRFAEMGRGRGPGGERDGDRDRDRDGDRDRPERDGDRPQPEADAPVSPDDL